tara:strand:+ start:994 stop:1188 length:195 start_codon:yes stop_codon:yes gene_type:complete
MTVQELIDKLNTIEDKDLLVRVLENNPNNPNLNMENYWVADIEVSNTGQSGYELNGEVILIGEE